MKRLGAILLSMALFSFVNLTPVNAQTQNQCSDRAAVIELLNNKYKERPVAVGVTNTGGLIEVLSSVDGKSWTIVVTTPQGMSCLVAAGEGWRSIDRPLLEPQANLENKHNFGFE